MESARTRNISFSKGRAEVKCRTSVVITSHVSMLFTCAARLPHAVVGTVSTSGPLIKICAESLMGKNLH